MKQVNFAVAAFGAALMIMWTPASSTASAQEAEAMSAPAAAAAASPELTGQLSSALGSTRDQAAGAAGALFGIAKSRLNAEDFAQVAKAVPGMNLLLKAAPAAGGGSAASSAMSQLGGTAGTLAAAASAFQKLGLSPDLVSKAIPILTSFVTKSGGANVGSLLAGVLK